MTRILTESQLVRFIHEILFLREVDRELVPFLITAGHPLTQNWSPDSQVIISRHQVVFNHTYQVVNREPAWIGGFYATFIDNSTHFTGSQMCVSWISPWTCNTCGFISRKPPALLLEESRDHFLLCLSSLASLCSLAANLNQRPRRCFRVEAAISLCLTSLCVTKQPCHQRLCTNAFVW